MVIKNNYDYIDAQRAKKATKIVVEYCQFCYCLFPCPQVGAPLNTLFKFISSRILI